LAGEAVDSEDAVGWLKIGSDVAQEWFGFAGSGERAGDKKVEAGELDLVDEALALEESPWVESDMEEPEGEQGLFDAGSADGEIFDEDAALGIDGGAADVDDEGRLAPEAADVAFEVAEERGRQGKLVGGGEPELQADQGNEGQPKRPAQDAPEAARAKACAEPAVFKHRAHSRAPQCDQGVGAAVGAGGAAGVAAGPGSRGP